MQTGPTVQPGMTEEAGHPGPHHDPGTPVMSVPSDRFNMQEYVDLAEPLPGRGSRGPFLGHSRPATPGPEGPPYDDEVPGDITIACTPAQAERLAQSMGQVKSQGVYAEYPDLHRALEEMTQRSSRGERPPGVRASRRPPAKDSPSVRPPAKTLGWRDQVQQWMEDKAPESHEPQVIRVVYEPRGRGPASHQPTSPSFNRPGRSPNFVERDLAGPGRRGCGSDEGRTPHHKAALP